MNDNKIVIKAYSSGTTEIQNAGLEDAEGLTFSSGYPGGMCLSMSFFVPRDVTSTWSLLGAQRITAWNGLTMVWEGYVASIAPGISADRQGMAVTCAGAWAKYLMARKTQKPWADTRVENSVWVVQIQAGHDNEIFSYEVESSNGIHITPMETVFSTGDYTALRYTAPTGQTIKRITYSYDFDENVQAWEQQVYDPTGAAAIAASQVTATATGSHDLTLATPRQAMELRMYARGNISATLDKHVHAKWISIVVYTETGTINAQEITKDIAALVTELSTDLTQIGAENVSLVPFINDPPRTYADALINAMSYGDTSYNRWAVYVGLSQDFSDGKPGLVLEQVPALTDYDYAIRMDEEGVQDNLSFTQDFSAVRNWIAIQYQDVSGRPVYVTPDDDATLKDTTSITAYGQQEEWITLATTSLSSATYQGKRYLAQWKDPQWLATGQITVSGSVRAKNGQSVPTSQILPGKRLKIENWLNDLSGTGLTFLISGTDYGDDGQTCAMAVGKPDPMEYTVERMQRRFDLQRAVSI